MLKKRKISISVLLTSIILVTGCHQDPKNLGEKILNDKDVDKIEEQKNEKEQEIMKFKDEMERLKIELSKYQTAKRRLIIEQDKVASLKAEIVHLQKTSLQKNKQDEPQPDTVSSERIDILENNLVQALAREDHAKKSYESYVLSQPISLRSDYENQLLDSWESRSIRCQQENQIVSQSVIGSFKINIDFSKQGTEVVYTRNTEKSGEQSLTPIRYDLMDLVYKDGYYMSIFTEGQDSQDIGYSTIAIKENTNTMLMEIGYTNIPGICSEGRIAIELLRI